jgi:hypothetical protein
MSDGNSAWYIIAYSKIKYKVAYLHLFFYAFHVEGTRI